MGVHLFTAEPVSRLPAHVPLKERLPRLRVRHHAVPRGTTHEDGAILRHGHDRGRQGFAQFVGEHAGFSVREDDHEAVRSAQINAYFSSNYCCRPGSEARP
jgi:hypothetical protein